MSNNTFLQNYQHLQYGIMYNKLVDLDFASIAWCGKDSSAFFNHAQVDGLLTESQLEEIEKELRSLKRKPMAFQAFWLEEGKKPLLLF